MKKIFYIIILFSFSRQVLGQTNFVTNPSFETYSACPVNVNSGSPDEILKATGWSTYKQTPDYYHACGTSTNVQVPANCWGSHFAATGNAYCGFQTKFTSGTREMLGSKLTTTLTIGTKYFVSFKTVKSWNTTCAGGGAATNNIGLRFSKVPFTVTNPPSVNNYAHLNAATVITDSLNWTIIKGVFVSDSAYQYVSLGNFFDDANTTMINGTRGYYLIDDICVSNDSLSCYAVTTGLKELNTNQKISFYPNPTSNYISINLPNQNKISAFYLLNSYGQVILTSTNYYADRIDLTNVPDGLYCIKVISDGKPLFDKIIVRH